MAEHFPHSKQRWRLSSWMSRSSVVLRFGDVPFDSECIFSLLKISPHALSVNCPLLASFFERGQSNLALPLKRTGQKSEARNPKWFDKLTILNNVEGQYQMTKI